MGPNCVTVNVAQKVYLGSVWQYVVRSGEMEFRIQTTWEINDPQVIVRLPAEHCAIFAETPTGN